MKILYWLLSVLNSMVGLYEKISGKKRSVKYHRPKIVGEAWLTISGVLGRGTLKSIAYYPYGFGGKLNPDTELMNEQWGKRCEENKGKRGSVYTDDPIEKFQHQKTAFGK